MSHTLSNNSDHLLSGHRIHNPPGSGKMAGTFSQKSHGHSHAIPQTRFCDYHAVEILRKGAGADTLSQRGGYIFILHGYRNYLMSDKEEICITDLLLDDRDKLSKV
jgi:hypothetical protein